MSIYVITYQGIEWNDIIEAFVDRSQAAKRARELNAEKGVDGLDSFSTYVITETKLTR